MPKIFSKKNLITAGKSLLTVLIATVIVVVVVKAGDLTPTSSPSDTMYTLDDIYYKLATSGSATSYNLDSPGSPTSTMHTLTEIYNKAPDFNNNPGTATTGDVCNSATFYTDSAQIATGTRTACSNPTEFHTGQQTSHDTYDDAYHDGTAKSFTDNGDGTVTDNHTNLMWEKDDRASSTWSNALDTCNNSTTGGYNDWRLPTIIEGVFMLDYHCSDSGDTNCYSAYQNDALNWSNCGPGCNFWLSTTRTDATSDAYILDTGPGNVSYNDKTYIYYVRCVRRQ